MNSSDNSPTQAGPRLVTGAEYEAHLTARESDRRTRAAFRDLVFEFVETGATLFDFGCGTGMDARFYAERGLSVRGYDADEAMCEYFETHCRELMETGRVTLERGTYREFLARSTPVDGQVDLVTANFAPLNLIDDLHELFAKFHALTAAHGRVLASVLSPYFIGDLRYGWWWRNVLGLMREGRFSVPGAQAPIVRRRLADFAAQSAPHFALERVYRGLPAPHRGAAHGIDTRQGIGATWLHLTSSRFIFLLFTKRAGVS